MKEKFSFLLTFLLFNAAPLFAADDFMRSTGKIYVVVAVLVLIFIGLGIYLFSMDRKLTKLEKQIKENGQNH